MKIIQIKKYPEDSYILRQACKPVLEVTRKERDLFNNMLYSMRFFNGIGLAGPQIGLSKKIIVVEVDDEILKIADPKIVEKKGRESMAEGCLSLPETSVNVKRPYKITVLGLNENNEKIEIKAEGLLARVIQHEVDHLNGRLIIDHMSFFEKLKHKKFLKSN